MNDIDRLDSAILGVLNVVTEYKTAFDGRLQALEAAVARPESSESAATAPEALRNCPCCGQTVPA